MATLDSRIVSIRKSNSLNPSSLSLPFIFIQPQFGYSADSIERTIHMNSKLFLGTYPNTFPLTIKEYFWIQDGEPGVKEWIALGVLKTGEYFLYTAQCNNTPKTFLNGGGTMNLWVSLKFSDLIHYAMDTNTYTTYFAETTVKELEDPIDAISQMSHQASDASEESAVAEPPVPS